LENGGVAAGLGYGYRGLISSTPGKRSKSASVEQIEAPSSIASAARCASEVRVPATPVCRRSWRRTFQWPIAGRNSADARLGEPLVDERQRAR
jgi:hypothetical protein